MTIPMTSPRQPRIAAVLSFVAPGLGHLYAGRPRAALVVAAAVQLIGWLVLTGWVLLPPSKVMLILGFALLLGALVGNIAYAAVAARRADPAYELRAYNRWYAYVAAFVVLTVWHQGSYALAKSYIVQAYRIPSPTMEPALLVGDYVYVAKVPRSARTPRHGAIVVFVSVEDSTARLHIVKRVIGMPGDTLHMVRDAVYRNHSRLDEPYRLRSLGTAVDHPQILGQIRAWQLAHYVGPDPASYQPTTHDWGPIVVPQEHCFVLGDNRDDSYDSRYWGFVPLNHVRGRPRFIYYSYNSSTHAVRWDRIGRGVP